MKRNYNNNRRVERSDEQKKGLTVEVRNGDFTKALRIFKKKVQEAGIVQEVRDRQQYIKPSEKRAKAKAAGRKRWLKKVQTMESEGWGPAPSAKKNRRH